MLQKLKIRFNDDSLLILLGIIKPIWNLEGTPTVLFNEIKYE